MTQAYHIRRLGEAQGGRGSARRCGRQKEGRHGDGAKEGLGDGEAAAGASVEDDGFGAKPSEGVNADRLGVVKIGAFVGVGAEAKFGEGGSVGGPAKLGGAAALGGEVGFADNGAVDGEAQG